MAVPTGCGRRKFCMNPEGLKTSHPRLGAHACGEFEPAGRVRELDRRPQHYQATNPASSCFGKEGLDHWDRVDRGGRGNEVDAVNAVERGPVRGGVVPVEPDCVLPFRGAARRADRLCAGSQQVEQGASGLAGGADDQDRAHRPFSSSRAAVSVGSFTLSSATASGPIRRGATASTV